MPQANESGVVHNIVHNIVEQWGGHLHTGNTGLTCLIDALTQYRLGQVLHDLVTAPIPISGGMLPLPHKPGLGVALRKEVLSWPDARVEVKE